MQPERPRARRYPFVANIELTDLQSDAQTREQTTDLSLFGCHISGGKSLATGTKVRLRIAHNGEIFEAQGRVANLRPEAGIGIVFTNIEEKHQSVLEEWVAELRSKDEAG